MGPTPTPTQTLGMRLSCNFVNVYTIAYCVQYTFTRVTRASLTNILVRKIARVGQVGGQVGEDRCACSASGKLNGEVAGHATSARDPRAEVGEDVRVAVAVSVSVSVGPIGFQLNGRVFVRDPKSRGFESRPVRFQLTAFGKLLNRTKQYNLIPPYGLGR